MSGLGDRAAGSGWTGAGRTHWAASVALLALLAPATAAASFNQPLFGPLSPGQWVVARLVLNVVVAAVALPLWSLVAVGVRQLVVWRRGSGQAHAAGIARVLLLVSLGWAAICAPFVLFGYDVRTTLFFLALQAGAGFGLAVGVGVHAGHGGGGHPRRGDFQRPVRSAPADAALGGGGPIITARRTASGRPVIVSRGTSDLGPSAGAVLAASLPWSLILRLAISVAFIGGSVAVLWPWVRDLLEAMYGG